MYKPHPNVLAPEGDVIIWRYMDFDKFEYLLKIKKIFFCRIDKFDDLFEGRSSEKLHSFFEIYKKYTYANCWIQDDYESNLMWKAYIKNPEGIAIKSSFTKLCKCFDDSEIEQNIGKVTYYDDLNLSPEENTLIPFFRKKREFKSENEIRAIHQMIEIDSNPNNPEKGIYVNVILTELIESIYTSPNSSPDFITKVKKTVSKYNLEKDVKTSELLYRPNSSSNPINKVKKSVSNFLKKENDTDTGFVRTISNEPTDTDASGNVRIVTAEFDQYIEVRAHKKHQR